MAKLAIKPGTTSIVLYLFIQNSSVTTGAGLTGLVFNSAGLSAYYVRPLGVATAITLATQTVGGAFSAGGFVEVDATNMPGVYRFDVLDAVIATGVRSAVVMLKGATNMAPVLLEIDLKNEVDNVTTLTGHTNQTGDAYAIANSGVHGNAALKTLIDTVDNFIDTEVASILAAVDTETAAILALLDDPRGEPAQGAPPVNPDFATKVDYLYAWVRNKKDNNGTETKIYADDGTTINWKQTTTEAAGTVTKGEIATGL